MNQAGRRPVGTGSAISTNGGIGKWEQLGRTMDRDWDQQDLPYMDSASLKKLVDRDLEQRNVTKDSKTNNVDGDEGWRNVMFA